MVTVEKIEIILTVPSIEETAAWYERVLGWTGHYDTFDAEGRCTFGSVLHGDMDAVMREEKPFTGFNLSRFQGEPSSYDAEVTHFTALIHVDDVDAVYDRVMESGIVTPGTVPENQPWGSRSTQLCWGQDLWVAGPERICPEFRPDGRASDAGRDTATLRRAGERRAVDRRIFLHLEDSR